MTGEYLKELINSVVFLLPVLLLVWKGAKLTARLETLEMVVKEKVEKFCKDHSEMERKINLMDSDNERDFKKLADTLVEIQKAVVRIETKLDLEEKKG